MEITDRQRRLLELCAIRVDRQSVDWSLIARQVQDAIGLDDLSQGIITEKSTAAERSRPVLRKGLRHMGPLADRVTAELEAASEAGARLVTVLDPDYPANLRLIPNLPPFLFYRGTLSDDDARSVAVVGTRQASETGLRRAAQMSRLLARQHVTVVSGLAKGIDTAAHRAALDEGWRTIAVLGTGITRCYPSENRDLAERHPGLAVLAHSSAGQIHLPAPQHCHEWNQPGQRGDRGIKHIRCENAGPSRPRARQEGLPDQFSGHHPAVGEGLCGQARRHRGGRR